MNHAIDQAPGAARYEIDLCGESCPYPVIRTLEALDALAPGELLEVTTDCPQSFRNIPDEALAHGSRLIGDPVREGARVRFLLEVGVRAPSEVPAPDRSVMRRRLRGLLGRR